MSRSLPANVIAAGNPVRVIKPLSEGGVQLVRTFNMDILCQFADDFMRERLRGNGFFRGWELFQDFD